MLRYVGRSLELIAAGLIGATFSSVIAIAWDGPTQVPPSGNVTAPVNVGTADQVKDGGLSVNSLAVFGNTIISGASRYLSFGETPGADGYGIRNNAGTLQFRNSGGIWSNFLPSTGVTSISFADGTTQTTAPSTGGITAVTTASCISGNGGSCTVSCPAAYFRVGCSKTSAGSGATSPAPGSSPSGSNACSCYASHPNYPVRCYAYCAR